MAVASKNYFKFENKEKPILVSFNWTKLNTLLQGHCLGLEDTPRGHWGELGPYKMFPKWPPFLTIFAISCAVLSVEFIPLSNSPWKRWFRWACNSDYVSSGRQSCWQRGARVQARLIVLGPPPSWPARKIRIARSTIPKNNDCSQSKFHASE